MANYATYQQAIAPPWLQQTYGARYLQAIGSVKDIHAQRTREAVFARLPGVAPIDAIPLIGTERSIIQGPTETLSDYRARLIAAWQAWQIAGSAWGVLAQLNAQGYNPYLVTANGTVYGPGATLTTPPAIFKSGYPWQFSGVPTQIWSAFCLVFDPLPAGWSPVNPPTPSTVPSSAQIELICSIVNTWKPAFATFAGILAVTNGPLWGWPRSGAGAAKWGASGRLWGGGVSTFFTC